MSLAQQKVLRAGGPVRGPRSVCVRATAEPAITAAPARVVVSGTGAYTVKGTSRKINEDRYDVKIAPPGEPGEPFAWAGVYDGHGGFAVADWLKSKLFGVVEKEWTNGYKPEFSITEAYLAADRQLLSVGAGFMGMGERGVGGSKCGATAANALFFAAPDGASTRLLTANVGDARIVLVRAGQPVQLSEDHVPDREAERQRIERMNPNPKLPLVRYMGGTWRVGGLLALSRAFGDAYLKGSLQFEGVAAGSDGYSSGFGVIAEPYTTVTPLTAEDSWLVVASDGLFAEEERGGGGGLDNQGLAEVLTEVPPGADLNKVAEALATAAVKVGSTDDVTLVVMRLGTA
ncbi:hypothetical protein PLESTB_000220100 [Pleodorina starrii]|uniref:PPM-type phosphatase domain-containing protein n=1 Tax=Pleodorina starrii TaxID=330485 RepID=A0A9W6BDA1_9CHLO|nr:hypothetical protein PLESTM_001545800 [Pleodorina starrii]GLC49446.1 hypothetical protein PLESTB_000220100 [Pleodorina starrii]GLC75679.1 hypothetical protein PLESTF_001673100 [Pleodorina starrii]